MDEQRTNPAERAPESTERPREEARPVKREKPPKKPGAVSRFFNQFGIGKYWEKLNDYFEYEEKMEATAAEREAKKETAEAMQIAGKEAVGEVKARGAEMPARIEESAARAGATSAEAASVIAEAKKEEAQVEAEAEAAKADFDKEIPVFLAEPEGAVLPSAEEIINAREAEELPGWEESEMADVTKAEMEKKAKKEAEGFPRAEEFEEDRDVVAKEREAVARNQQAKEIKPKTYKPGEFEVLEEEVIEPKAEELPPVEEFEAIAKEHEVRDEMEKAKVEPVTLGKIKKKEKSFAEEREGLSMQEFFGDFGFKVGDKVKIRLDSGEVDPGWALINIGRDKKSALVGKIGKDGEPMAKRVDLEELKQLKQEEEFFEKGEKESGKITQRMEKSLSKKRAVYAAQKAAEKISSQDKKALNEWAATIKEPSRGKKETKPVKSAEKKKTAKKKAAGRRAA